MFSFLIQFIKIVYPVLKESLLGKQSLLEAIKTSKIKVLVLVYCLTSPAVIGFAFNKTVSLASTNITQSKKIAELNLAVAQLAASDVKRAVPPVVAVKVSTAATYSAAPSITRKSTHKRPPHIVPDIGNPDNDHSHNLEEILNRNHEYN